MDFLKKFAETSISKDETPAEKSPEKSPPAEEEHSNSDLMSSAKVVADAARSTVQKEPPKYDNSQVAGAAADLLDAAQTYGKMDQTSGVGSYIEKAENYLHDYEAKNSVKPKEAEPKKEEGEAKPSEPEAVKKEEDEAKPSEPEPVKKEEDEAKPSEPEPAKKEEDEGEKDFAKIAEGGLAKLAGGFKF